jgi:hypothetical protein
MLLLLLLCLRFAQQSLAHLRRAANTMVCWLAIPECAPARLHLMLGAWLVIKSATALHGAWVCCCCCCCWLPSWHYWHAMKDWLQFGGGLWNSWFMHFMQHRIAGGCAVHLGSMTTSNNALGACTMWCVWVHASGCRWQSLPLHRAACQ